MSAVDVFRCPLDKALKLHKRSALFRHVLFSLGELDDPIEPEIPFIQILPLPELEERWRFSRDAVPDYIRLTVGRAARARFIEKLTEEYNLPTAERFRRIKDRQDTWAHETKNPETWSATFAVFIHIPAGVCGLPMDLHFAGGREQVLTHPMWRPWYFSPLATVWHGEEALEMARAMTKERGTLLL